MLFKRILCTVGEFRNVAPHVLNSTVAESYLEPPQIYTDVFFNRSQPMLPIVNPGFFLI